MRDHEFLDAVHRSALFKSFSLPKSLIKGCETTRFFFHFLLEASKDLRDWKSTYFNLIILLPSTWATAKRGSARKTNLFN